MSLKHVERCTIPHILMICKETRAFSPALLPVVENLYTHKCLASEQVVLMSPTLSMDTFA